MNVTTMCQAALSLDLDAPLSPPDFDESLARWRPPPESLADPSDEPEPALEPEPELSLEVCRPVPESLPPAPFDCPEEPVDDRLGRSLGSFFGFAGASSSEPAGELASGACPAVVPSAADGAAASVPLLEPPLSVPGVSMAP